MGGYITRTMEKMVQKTADSFPIVALYGPRQVGKSTLLRYMYPDMRYVTLDDAAERSLAKQNPRLFLQSNPWPVIIDEIQKAPELLPEIKITVDEQRLDWLNNDEQRQVMYFLTGSSQFELRSAVSESLAGRVGELELSSFSYAEITGLQGKPFNPRIEALQKAQRTLGNTARTRMQIFEDIFKGGMPDIITGVSERNIYFPSYVSTYIERDVRNLIAAGSEETFMRFMSYVAMRTAQQVNYEEIAGAVGINGKTCRRWLSILESSGLIFFLQPYYPNASTRIIKAPKFYFSDTGLASYLCGWPNATLLERGAMAGAMYETYVVSEIVKSFANAGLNPSHYLYYYRDKDNKEIDVLYVVENTIFPIEIKKGISPVKPHKNFSVLSKYNMPIMPGVVIDSTEKLRAINENVWACPVTLIGV